MSEFPYKIGGAIPSPVDPRDYRLPAGISGEELPEEWYPKQIPVHNQGQINSCVAHAIAAGYEQQGFPSMAYGYIYGDRRHTDWTGEGLIVRDALKTVQKDGVPSFKSYPYDAEAPEIIKIFEQNASAVDPEAAKNTLGPYYRLYSNEECCRAMFNGMDVFFSLYLFENFKQITKENPVMPLPDTTKTMVPLGGHAVIGNGWGKKGCRLLNSWGEEWGENGNFYIPDEAFTWSETNGFPIPLVEAWAIQRNKSPEPQQTGWYKQGEKWRYSKDGKDATGWLLDRGTWYYLDPDGFMAADTWRFIDGCWYYLTSSGAMVRGWRLISGKWYYFRPGTDKMGPNGSMVTGWLSLDGQHYFLNNDPDGPIPFGAMIATDSSGAVQTT